MHRKIDTFLYQIHSKTWKYSLSTQSYKTCKEAKAKYLSMYPDINPARVKCSFA